MKALAIIFALLSVCKTSNQNLSHDNPSSNQISINRRIMSDNLGCIPDSTLFRFKRLNETLDETKVDAFKALKPISQKESDAWFKPFFGERYEVTDEIRMVAFQRMTDKYFSFLIVRMFDIGVNLKGNEYIICDQFLITTDRQGNYISGLKVFDNNRVDDRDEDNWENNFDKEMNAYKTYDGVRTKFCQDTIKVYELTGFCKDLNSSKKTDYWENNFVTQYIITKNGEITCLKPREKTDNDSVVRPEKITQPNKE